MMGMDTIWGLFRGCFNQIRGWESLAPFALSIIEQSQCPTAPSPEATAVFFSNSPHLNISVNVSESVGTLLPNLPKTSPMNVH